MSGTSLRLSAGKLSVELLARGVTLRDVRLQGVAHSLTLGSSNSTDYRGPMCYFGAIVGPVANRISGGQAQLDGQSLRFDINEPPATCLHGGEEGTHAQRWTLIGYGPGHATFSLDLPDGQGGFPGNRTLTARYSVEAPATLRLELSAMTDAPTLMNLANHSYWCLDDSGTIDSHRMTIAADHYTPVDARLIPTGNAVPVEGTPFDFRRGRVLGDPDDPAYDHNFCLAEKRGPLRLACRLEGRDGVVMEVETTEPGLQVYTGSGLETAPAVGHTGAPYGPGAGVAIEPQCWPDAPNRPGFPSVRLNPGETYRQETVWRFSKR